MSEAKFTKGPWRWEINLKSKDVELCGCGIEVLRFERYGMQGAAPTFVKPDDTFLIQGAKAKDLATPIYGREHHAGWCQTINHPDAHLIAASPEMYEDIESDIEWLKQIRAKFVIGSNEYRSICIRIETKSLLLAKARGEQCKKSHTTES